MTNPKKSSAYVDPVIEVVTDVLTIVADVSIVGLPAKLYKAATGIRESIFFNKLKRFFEELDSVPEEVRTKFWSTYDDNQGGKQKLGEQIVIYLDRQDTLDKSVLLAKAFSAHIRGEIKKDDFLDLAVLIDVLKIHHLEKIVTIVGLAGGGSSFRDILVSDEWERLIPEMTAQGLLEGEDRLEVIEDLNRKKQTIVKRKYKSTVLAKHLLTFVVEELAQDVSVKIEAYHKRRYDVMNRRTEEM